MIIDSNIKATEGELAKIGINLQKCQQDLTLPNPEYQNSMRFRKGRFFKPIPKYLCYLKKEGYNYVVPRYYNGEPTEMNGAIKGRPLTSTCNIKLRDYQEDFVKEYSEVLYGKTSGVLMEAPCGHGKCHGKGTKILMFDGSIKNVEDIVVGDLLMGDDSTPRKVLSLARGREELFTIHQNKGEDYVVNRSHILTLQYRPYGKGCDKSRFGEIVDIPLEKYLSLTPTEKKYYYGFCVPVEFPHKELPIPAYLLGLWLGDGTSKEISFTCDHRDAVIVKYYYKVAKEFGCEVHFHRQYNADGTRNNSNVYRIVGTTRGATGHIKNPLRNLFEEFNLINNKHIPLDYLTSDRESRLQLLAGIIDTDGSYSNYVLEITQKRKELAEDIRRLCWSLGFRVRMTERTINGGTYWRMIISGNIHEIPTRLPRKKIPQRTINKDPFVNSISVESIGEGDYYGFTLDGNHRYCLVDSTVTHNTVLGIWFAYVRGYQTLVIVPTYYLAKQWAQRISEMTTATCTIIKPTDKDVPTDSDFSIVVADLFTCRVLPKELINNIGHVILDEAHRMGAETYMPILDEIPALYRTALTATFRRQDGMHQILKYHFGTHIKMGNRFPRPEIYAVKTSVEVNALISTKKVKPSFVDFLERNGVKYHETPNALSFQWDKELRDSADDLLHTGVLTKTAYREVCAGLKVSQEMQYPTLDSYLNDHAGRRKETIQLIQKCLDAGRTILFLSKRKDTLRALHKYFEKYKPMLIVSETNARSEEDENYLQKDCRLIFGVTQLAKEGLDIDRLDTLIIHLPMKDTEQAVGRISRIHPTKQRPVCFYLLDQCPITYAVYSNAKKYFKINGEFKGEIKLRQVPQVLE